ALPPGVNLYAISWRWLSGMDVADFESQGGFGCGRFCNLIIICVRRNFMKREIRSKLVKITVCMVVLWILGTVITGNAFAAVKLAEIGQGNGTVTADLDVIGRYENWEWFDPGTNDNEYGYYFTRTRLGLGLNLSWMAAYIQAQDTHMWNLPENAIAPAPAGPLGIGAIYYAHGHQERYHSTIIRQAYLDFPNLVTDGFSARIGRFDYIEGLEVLYDNPKINWLKKMRLAERLIGTFGWSSFCRSFDGIKLSYDNTDWNLTGAWIYPTQGGFENDAQKTIDDIDVGTLTLTAKYNTLIPNVEGRIFYFRYDDSRDIPKVDNTGAVAGDIEINTLGFHLVGIYKSDRGIADALIWSAYQNGDWGRLDHKAWAYAIEAGYQFTTVFGKPWIRVGFDASSGDSNSADGDHETFYQMLPTVYKYAHFPFYNLMNSEDLFIQAILKPMKNVVMNAEYHMLKLSERNDLWYMGSGPTRENDIFGYIGRPSGGDDELARVLGLTTVYTYNEHFSGTFFYGHAFGGDVVQNIYTKDDDANFFYLQVNLRF
ncbi:MAG: alginate export family protein, partial [Deltaproteobacteria bacterium]